MIIWGIFGMYVCMYVCMYSACLNLKVTLEREMEKRKIGSEMELVGDKIFTCYYSFFFFLRTITVDSSMHAYLGITSILLVS